MYYMKDKIVVLKFGGSSVADNERLEKVANKVLKFKEEYKKIIVILSAQGKTTDKLISEAKELAKEPDKRETAGCPVTCSPEPCLIVYVWKKRGLSL